MALVQCRECKKEISNTVKKCPHCGYKNKMVIKSFKKDKIIKVIIVILLVVLAVMSYLYFTTPDPRRNLGLNENKSNTINEITVSKYNSEQFYKILNESSATTYLSISGLKKTYQLPEYIKTYKNCDIFFAKLTQEEIDRTPRNEGKIGYYFAIERDNDLFISHQEKLDSLINYLDKMNEETIAKIISFNQNGKKSETNPTQGSLSQDDLNMAINTYVVQNVNTKAGTWYNMYNPVEAYSYKKVNDTDFYSVTIDNSYKTGTKCSSTYYVIAGSKFQYVTSDYQDAMSRCK